MKNGIAALMLAVVLAIALAAAAYSHSLAPGGKAASRVPSQPEPVQVSGILFVGRPTGLADEVLSELESRSGQTAPIVTALSDLFNKIGAIDDGSIVVFQSEWCIGKVGEPELLDFLGAILVKETKIVAIGSSTSLLFEALDRVTEVFVAGRNPGYNDPPVVGFKLRSATAPDGTNYQGQSILISNTASAREAADSVLMWR